MNDPLERFAQRVAADPFFLAPVLAAYAQSERLDDAALAAKLACSAETLTLLRLCRNPHPESPRFWQDISEIALQFNVDPDNLANIVRLGQAFCRLPQTPAKVSGKAGFLMAARDADAPPEEPS